MKEDILADSKGITLISLVVTIILLLILAGTTITAIIKENGIMSQSKKAVKEFNIESVKEDIRVAISTIEVEDLANGKNTTLNTFLEEIEDKNRNRLENELYNKDQYVLVSLDASTENVKVNYKGYSFYIDSNFFINEVPINVTKLDEIAIPHKKNMTYYFDYEAFNDNSIENYGTGTVPIEVVNASVDNNSIYFTGNNSSYAYTSENLGSHNYFTIYYVSKFDAISSYNYCISTLSKDTSKDFGVGLGRMAAGGTRHNLLFMVYTKDNYTNSKYDITNYYVNAIVYDGEYATFYVDGEKKAKMSANNVESTFYFASYLDRTSNMVRGGSLIRFKQFAFVDAIHNPKEVEENSNFLYNKYLK